MRRIVAVAALLLSGCATWSPFPSAATRLLGQGDAFVDRGRYPDAIATYDDVLHRYPETGAAQSARARRDTVASLLTSREEVARLRQGVAARQAEVERLSKDLSAREAELMRVRRDLATRQADLTRLTLEMEQLRSDLERLKRIEMRLERRRP